MVWKLFDKNMQRQISKLMLNFGKIYFPSWRLISLHTRIFWWEKLDDTKRISGSLVCIQNKVNFMDCFLLSYSFAFHLDVLSWTSTQIWEEVFKSPKLYQIIKLTIRVKEIQNDISCIKFRRFPSETSRIQ